MGNNWLVYQIIKYLDEALANIRPQSINFVNKVLAYHFENVYLPFM